jgi:hypothetical protein
VPPRGSPREGCKGTSWGVTGGEGGGILGDFLEGPGGYPGGGASKDILGDT